MKRPNRKKSGRTDRPTLPELDLTKRSVLNSLASIQSRRSYQHASAAIRSSRPMASAGGTASGVNLGLHEILTKPVWVSGHVRNPAFRTRPNQSCASR
jgi:hypothetical protein